VNKKIRKGTKSKGWYLSSFCCSATDYDSVVMA